MFNAKNVVRKFSESGRTENDFRWLWMSITGASLPILSAFFVKYIADTRAESKTDNEILRAELRTELHTSLQEIRTSIDLLTKEVHFMNGAISQVWHFSPNPSLSISPDVSPNPS